MNWLKANWKSILLVASLSLNLVIIAGMATHAMRESPRLRIQAASWSQLLPRDFFVNLPETRRKQLLGSLKSYRNVFRDGRTGLRSHAGEVADALDAEPFDQLRLAQALDKFGAQGRNLMDEGTHAAHQVLEALTPEERKALAAAIRRRAF